MILLLDLTQTWGNRRKDTGHDVKLTGVAFIAILPCRCNHGFGTDLTGRCSGYLSWME